MKVLTAVLVALLLFLGYTGWKNSQSLSNITKDSEIKTLQDQRNYEETRKLTNSELNDKLTGMFSTDPASKDNGVMPEDAESPTKGHVDITSLTEGREGLPHSRSEGQGRLSSPITDFIAGENPEPEHKAKECTPAILYIKVNPDGSPYNEDGRKSVVKSKPKVELPIIRPSGHKKTKVTTKKPRRLVPRKRSSTRKLVRKAIKPQMTRRPRHTVVTEFLKKKEPVMSRVELEKWIVDNGYLDILDEK